MIRLNLSLMVFLTPGPLRHSIVYYVNQLRHHNSSTRMKTVATVAALRDIST